MRPADLADLPKCSAPAAGLDILSQVARDVETETPADEPDEWVDSNDELVDLEEGHDEDLETKFDSPDPLSEYDFTQGLVDLLARSGAEASSSRIRHVLAVRWCDPNWIAQHKASLSSCAPFIQLVGSPRFLAAFIEWEDGTRGVSLTDCMEVQAFLLGHGPAGTGYLTVFLQNFLRDPREFEQKESLFKATRNVTIARTNVFIIAAALKKCLKAYGKDHLFAHLVRRKKNKNKKVVSCFFLLFDPQNRLKQWIPHASNPRIKVESIQKNRLQQLDPS